MKEIAEKKYYDLKNRIFERFDCQKVEMNYDKISMYDLFKSLKNSLQPYNELLINRIQNDISYMNKRNGYNFLVSSNKEKKLRRIGNIVFTAQENGYYYCTVHFVNGQGAEIGTCNVDNTMLVGNADDEVLRNKNIFLNYLNMLAHFVINYPGVRYEWNINNPFIKPTVVGDDFISAKLNLQNLNGPTVYFTNYEDFGLAAYKDNTHSELYDYISFYNDEVMKKTEVSIDDLDPTIQFFVRNYNGLKKEKKLVK